MNAEAFRAWLIDHEACEDALQWLGTLEDSSLQAAWTACPCGDWMLWLHEQAGTPFEVLAPVVYKAVNRALGRAALELDKAGVEHKLGEIVVEDRASAHTAWDAAIAAAQAAEAIKATDAAIGAVWAAAGAAASAEIGAAAEAAQRAAALSTFEVEERMCADDCRELLEMPVLTKDEEKRVSE